MTRLYGRLAIVLASVPLLAETTVAYETDQYSHRFTPIADCTAVLDREVNAEIARVAAEWRGGESRARFARRVWRRLGGLHWVDRIERFAMRSAEVEKLPQFRRQSIFAGAPLRATRVNFVFGVGRTIRLGGSLLGSDKLGHFFSQGLKYWRSHRAGWSDERVAGRGRFNERWIFGQLTTSVYSNADLVANWEGYLFYRGLFEDGVVAGKPALVRFENGRATLQRPFTWTDHVNDYWDEALNPSHWSPTLARALRPRLERLCDDGPTDDSHWVSPHESELAARYQGLGLRQDLDWRLDTVCRSERVR